MADARLYVCDHCQHSITAWSDGNPYYIDESGARQYAYHPDHERLDRCIGNDSPHLCLSCGHEFNVDSLNPATACLECESEQFVSTYRLEGQKCPYCKAGQFLVDPEYYVIS